MAEEFVTEEELLGGDPSLTADSTQNGMPNDERTYTGVYHFTDFDNETGDLLYMGHYSEFYNDVTADDLEQYFEQSEDLQSIFGSFDNYLSYMNERQDLIDSGVNLDWIGSVSETQEQVYEDRIRLQQLVLKETQGGTLTAEELAEKQQLEDAGVTPALLADAGMGAETDGPRSYTEAFNNVMQSEEMQALNEAYGIPSEFTNDSGDTMFWTGSGLAQKDKFNERYGQVIGQTLFAIAASVIAGPVGAKLTGALVNAGMSQAAAAAASNAIMNSAVQLAVTGDVDITQALFSAAGTYLSQSGVEVILGDSEFGQALSDLANTAEGVITDFQDLISTGNSIADAAIQAGGMSMLISLVQEGEVDVQQAIIAAGMAGGTEFLNQLAESGVATQEQIDEYQEMGPPEELAGTDLDGDGITDTEVADGLFMLSDGTVVNADNETIGTMDELDLDGNGVLDASDLQEVTVDAQPIGAPSAVIDEGVRYYRDQNGNLVAQGDITGLRVDRDTGNYIDTDGNVYVYAGQGNAAGEVFDPYNGILTASDGTVLAVYDPDVGWVDTEGNYVGATREEYLNYLSSGDPSGATQGFGMTREDYDNMTGQELVDDLFVQRGTDGQVTMTTEELSALMQKFDSVEEFEQYMQEQGIGVNVSGNTVVLVGGALDDSDEGVWNITDGTDPLDLYGDPDELSDTVFVDTDSSDVYVVEESPFAEEPVETEDQTEPESDILDSTEETLEGATGDPATGAEPGGASAQELEQQYEDAVNAGDLLLAEQIAEQMENLETQPADATQPDSVTKPDVIDIFESEGQTSTPIGPAPSGSAIVDDRTQWQKNKDYIISQVSAGEATAGQLEWYERWQAAGSPETQEGMGSGTGAQEGISTGEGGGLTGETGAGAPSPESPVRPAIAGLAGLIAGQGLSTQLPGMLDAGTGDPDIGEGIGGVGEGGTGEDGMLTQKSPFRMPDFNPLYTTIEYTTPTIQPIIVDNRQDYVRELDGLINRGLFTSQKGIA